MRGRIDRFRLWLALQLFRAAGVVAPDGEHAIETMGGRLKFSKTTT